MFKKTSPKPADLKKIRKKIPFILFSVCTIACSINSIASTIKVPSPGADNDIQPEFQAAVDRAVNGDVVELPAGQFVVNKNVTVTSKFVSVKGAGLGKTILYRSSTALDKLLSYDDSWRGILRYVTNSTRSSGIVISDITFRSKKPSLVKGDNLSVAEDMGIEMVRCVDFVITRCRFEYFGNGAISVTHDDELAGGLINKNEFFHNCKGYDALGLGYGVVIYGVDKNWVKDPKFGSSNFIFVEDNLFDYHRHSIAAGGCALYVFRYNTVRNNVAGNTAHAIDAHEARMEGVENYYSTRAIEVYNNVITNTTFRDGTTNCPDGTAITAGKSASWLTECAIRTRGGEALIHDNRIQGYRFGVGLITPTLETTTAYPNPYQQGYESGLKYGPDHTGVDGDKGNGDVFVWNDTYNSYDQTSKCVYFYNYSTDYIVKERDYHLFAKKGYTTYTYPHPLSTKVTGIESGSIENPFKIYPNPAEGGVINIETGEAISEGTIVQVINSSGALVEESPLESNLLSLSVQNLATGIYLIRIIAGYRKSFTSKVAIVN